MAVPSYMRRYIWRIVIFMSLYSVGLISGSMVFEVSALSVPARIALALCAALPICGVFWAVFRLLVETDDEYQQLLFAKQILVGTAATMCIATMWQFLSMYEVTAQGPQWIGAIWFAMFGLAGAVVRRGA